MIHITVMPEYKPGDQAPEGYLQWHEWAEDQYKSGLRQKECGKCGKWKFPQELSQKTITCTLNSREGDVIEQYPICLKCEKHTSGARGKE